LVVLLARVLTGVEWLFVPSVLPETDRQTHTLGGPQGRVMITRDVIFMVKRERYE